MKVRSAVKLLIILLLTAILYLVLILGIGPNKIGAISNIKLGLDLQGGVSILYEADTANPTQDQMSAAISVIQERLAEHNETEASVSQVGTNRISVDIPNISDPEQAISYIGKTAQIQFVDEDGNVILDGTDIADASKVVDQQTGQVEVELKFNSDGKDKFSQATAANVGKTISIELDGTPISTPTVDQEIDSDTAVIQGDFTAQSAEDLANLIRSGSLPFNLNVISAENIGATLGIDSLKTSVVAGIIGFGLIILFMLYIYRMSGFSADFALIIYAGLELLLISLLQITLTLPGIAGIILSVGMAVDGNIIIFERTKDEFRNGKSIRPAVDAGFKRATAAIIDSNVTTIIAGLVLLVFGIGSVRGFAQTLIIGLILSVITSLLITRVIEKNIIGLGFMHSNWYGAKLTKEQKIEEKEKRAQYKVAEKENKTKQKELKLKRKIADRERLEKQKEKDKLRKDKDVQREKDKKEREKARKDVNSSKANEDEKVNVSKDDKSDPDSKESTEEE